MSSDVILTPEKMRQAMKSNPWEVLLDIRPVSHAMNQTNQDMVPIHFEENGIQYIGWQLRGAIPMLFDCEYRPELWNPNSQQHPSPSFTNPERPQLLEKLVKITAEQLGLEQSIEDSIGFDTARGELGEDSLDEVEFIIALEEEFEIEIPDDDAERFRTLRDVFNYISSQSHLA